MQVGEKSIPTPLVSVYHKFDMIDLGVCLISIKNDDLAKTCPVTIYFKNTARIDNVFSFVMGEENA